MKTFFKSLLSSKGAISSKRVISLYSLLLLTSYVIISFCGIEVKEFIFWGLVSLVGVNSGMSIIEKFKNTP